MIDCNITKNYFNEKQRMTKKRKIYAGMYMCELDCSDCPLSSLNNDATDKMTCGEFEALCPEQAIEAVQRWSDEHPPKTFLTEFLKNYPNAQLRMDGTPKGTLGEFSKMGKDFYIKNIEALKIAKQAVEKQIPKKPKEYEDKYYACPACGNVLLHKWEKYPEKLTDKSNGLPYCLSCGQAFDWSDETEGEE